MKKKVKVNSHWKKIGESDKELESIFIQKLKELWRNNMEEIQPREKLEKIKVPTVIRESAERIPEKYLEIVNEIPEITDMVYAMGNAIAEKMGIKKKKEPRNSHLEMGIEESEKWKPK